MSIFDNLLEKSTDLKHYDQYSMAPDFVKMDSGPTLNYNGIQQEFYLEARICVTFWANQVQYEGAKKLAEQALVHRLYGEVLDDIEELRLQIQNGNRDACHHICNRMEARIER